MTIHERRLLVRWSWRDLRRRWVLVTAIALVIAVGTGVFAGLGSTAEWRRQSNDASYALLHMHDLRIMTSEGTDVSEGRLLAVVSSIPHAADVQAADERLLASVQVDASTGTETILVPGVLVGAPLRGDEQVDGTYVGWGRALTAGDDGAPTVVLDRSFAKAHELADHGTLRLTGGATANWVGLGMSPSWFYPLGRNGVMTPAGNYAPIFTSLASAQTLTGRTGRVNDLVLTLRPGADRDTIQHELEAALAASSDVSATIQVREDDDVYRLLYEDIDNDQELWNVVALLILAGAAFASFNLTSRIVESERREIGIGMALGVPPRRLAVRPLLVGVQIALIGVVAGVLIGFGVDQLLRGLYEDVLPLPIWRTPFQPGVFVWAALLGMAMPMVATIIPVWRAVRVQPVDAIRTTALTASSGLVPLVRKVPLPGRSFAQLPLRNVLRTPRRTVLTALGVGAAITTVVATLGLLDTFRSTIDTGETELNRGGPDRMMISLERFMPVNSPEVTAITTDPAVGEVEPFLRVGSTIVGGKDDIDVMVGVLDMHGGLWSPSIVAGDLAAHPDGIVLSEKAAHDLGVAVGGTITLRHPLREGLGYRMVDSQVVVAALHPNPIRSFAYFDAPQAALFNLDGITNALQARPAPGVSEDDMERALFGKTGVGAVDSVRSTTKALEDALDQYSGILRVAGLFVLILALLIAFNSTSITVDERAREHATMFAFGVRVRTVVRMATVESLATGVLATILGIATGWFVLRWIVDSLLPQTMPELEIHPSIAMSTMLTALLFGVVAVCVAPLFTVRRLRAMDIPATLRVVE